MDTTNNNQQKVNPLKDLVMSKSKAMLGYPIVDYVKSDAEGLEASFSGAFLTYWTSFPYVHRMVIRNVNLESPLHLPYDDIIKDIFPEEEDYERMKDMIYPTGYVGLYENTGSGLSTDGLLNKLLVGINASSGNTVSSSSGMLTSYNKTQEVISAVKLYDGTLQILRDDVKKRFDLYLPTATLEYHISFALAFYFNDETLNFIAKDKILIFSNILAVNYLERLISARSSIKIDTDYSIDISFLQTKLSELKQSLNEELKRSIIVPIIYG